MVAQIAVLVLDVLQLVSVVASVVLLVSARLRVKSNLHEEAVRRLFELGEHVEATVKVIMRVDAVLTGIGALPTQSHLGHVALSLQLGLLLGYLCLIC